MMRILITSVLLLSFLQLLSCDCKTKKTLDIARQMEFEHSDLVFLGEVIFVSIDRMKFKIKVLEAFKGKIQENQVIEGENHTYCSPNANSTGLWLIYGHFENGKLKTNICGLSRSQMDPEDNRYFWIPAPPPTTFIDSTHLTKEDQEKEFMRINKFRQIAKSEFQKEIELLRNKK